tara:strand:- start:1161 stop:1289 length:129 start_codon:yes stop_codon:yes gene_type:complete
MRESCHWGNCGEMSLCPLTGVLANKMLHDARMAGMTGRAAAS